MFRELKRKFFGSRSSVYASRKYSYYYKKIIENYSSYDDLLKLFDPVKNNTMFLSASSELVVTFHDLPLNSSIIDVKRSISGFLEVKNPVIPEHSIVIVKEKIQRYFFRFSFHFFNNIFFYGKLVVVNYSTEAVDVVRKLLLEKYKVELPSDAEQFMIKGKGGIIIFRSFGESICEYFEYPFNVYNLIEKKSIDLYKSLEISKQRDLDKLKRFL